jgi:hypothetical protein
MEVRSASSFRRLSTASQPLNFALDDLPYSVTDCLEAFVVKQDQDQGIDYVKYTRPGRAWTLDEVGELAETVFGDWNKEFGELEEAIPAELLAVVMSYF